MDIPEVLRQHYDWIKHHSASDEAPGVVYELTAGDRIGLIADIAALFSQYRTNIIYFQSWKTHDGHTHLLIQSDDSDDGSLPEVLKEIPSVLRVAVRPPASRTFGKRIIVIGGGAQVAQVASGAITEADRHNMRGETISVDTIAIVGEAEIAAAVRAVGRLHRAGLLVLAGALMGGEVTKAVKELRENYGIPVISLNMAGSVPRAADLVVSDPLQAGVMAVMLISHIGKFNLYKVHGRRY
ncbi:MAG: DUF5612 domain-containing protein [Spirochaetales bacterium]|nr:DUF5612 domain-containing protein [Spirochaetales bacterium]